MRPIMLLNVSSQEPPNTVSCGLDAQKQTETDAGEGGKGGNLVVAPQSCA